MGLAWRQHLTISHRWHWVLVPILAVLAYLPALGVGFLSDDYGFLFRAETRDLRGYLGWQILLPSHGAGVAFYRPFGMLTTWQFDWQLWGLNPFPYHLLGLLLHSATALVLGLVVFDLVGKRSAGLLAGAFFAVFPIHTEAVGWLSAQWDIWAALFAITSLWLFSKWWRTITADPNSTASKLTTRLLYILALLAYTLAIFSKESALTWIGILCLVPLFTLPKRPIPASRVVGKAMLALLPFCAVLLAYLTIRVVALGSFGGYAAASNSLEIFSKNAISDVITLLAPVSPAVVGDPIKLLVGFLSGILLLIGLVLYARNRPKMVVICLTWLALSFVPVLNLSVRPDDLQGNRLLYLPAAGYCALIMILVQGAVERPNPRARVMAGGLVGAALVMFAVLSWVQVSVWQIATRQADSIGDTLARLVPDGGLQTSTPPPLMLWYVQNAPDTYRGAQVMKNGLDDQYHFLTGAPPPRIEYVTDLDGIPLSDKQQDAFVIRFAYDDAASRFYPSYIAGMSTNTTPPTGSNKSSLWDFQACSPEVVSVLETHDATLDCRAGKGLTLTPKSNDPQLLLPITEPLRWDSGSYLRIGISARYPAAQVSVPGKLSRIFWSVEGQELAWTEEQSRAMQVPADGNPYTYWLVIPSEGKGQTISGFRYDPPPDTAPPGELMWVQVDIK